MRTDTLNGSRTCFGQGCPDKRGKLARADFAPRISHLDESRHTRGRRQLGGPVGKTQTKGEFDDEARTSPSGRLRGGGSSSSGGCLHGTGGYAESGLHAVRWLS